MDLFSLAGVTSGIRSRPSPPLPRAGPPREIGTSGGIFLSCWKARPGSCSAAKLRPGEPKVAGIARRKPGMKSFWGMDSNSSLSRASRIGRPMRVTLETSSRETLLDSLSRLRYRPSVSDNVQSSAACGNRLIKAPRGGKTAPIVYNMDLLSVPT